MRGRVLGIDASRNRSGGAVAHLVGLLGGADPTEHGFGRVHVWAHRELADALPRRPWLEVHVPDATEGRLPAQLWWQWRTLPRLAREAGCALMFNTDAGSVCPFRPAVTLSQDLLSYEPGEMARYGISPARLRLLALRWVQNASFRRSAGVLFLTRYAADLVQEATGPLAEVAVIPHGIDPAFRAREDRGGASGGGGGREGAPVRLVYVSAAAPYKHPWNVVRAVEELRREGHDATLLLLGGGSGAAQRRLEEEMGRADPAGAWVRQAGFVPPEEVRRHLFASDVFVFASSCENMPITLLEGMAAGLPIACSDRGPMPEVLEDHGVYMDPESPASIAGALRTLLEDAGLRERLGREARRASERFTWEETARRSWAFLADVAEKET